MFIWEIVTLSLCNIGREIDKKLTQWKQPNYFLNNALICARIVKYEYKILLRMYILPKYKIYE